MRVYVGVIFIVFSITSFSQEIGLNKICSYDTIKHSEKIINRINANDCNGNLVFSNRYRYYENNYQKKAYCVPTKQPDPVVKEIMTFDKNTRLLSILYLRDSSFVNYYYEKSSNWIEEKHFNSDKYMYFKKEFQYNKYESEIYNKESRSLDSSYTETYTDYYKNQTIKKITHKSSSSNHLEIYEYNLAGKNTYRLKKYGKDTIIYEINEYHNKTGLKKYYSKLEKESDAFGKNISIVSEENYNDWGQKILSFEKKDTLFSKYYKAKYNKSYLIDEKYILNNWRRSLTHIKYYYDVNNDLTEIKEYQKYINDSSNYFDSEFPKNHNNYFLKSQKKYRNEKLVYEKILMNDGNYGVYKFTYGDKSLLENYYINDSVLTQTKERTYYDNNFENVKTYKYYYGKNQTLISFSNYDIKDDKISEEIFHENGLPKSQFKRIKKGYELYTTEHKLFNLKGELNHTKYTTFKLDKKYDPYEYLMINMFGDTLEYNVKTFDEEVIIRNDELLKDSAGNVIKEATTIYDSYNRTDEQYTYCKVKNDRLINSSLKNSYNEDCTWEKTMYYDASGELYRIDHVNEGIKFLLRPPLKSIAQFIDTSGNIKVFNINDDGSGYYWESINSRENVRYNYYPGNMTYSIESSLNSKNKWGEKYLKVNKRGELLFYWEKLYDRKSEIIKLFKYNDGALISAKLYETKKGRMFSKKNKYYVSDLMIIKPSRKKITHKEYNKSCYYHEYLREINYKEFNKYPPNNYLR